jgi:hypothetical protein
MYSVTIKGNSVEELYANLETLLKAKPATTAQAPQATPVPVQTGVVPSVPFVAPAPMAPPPVNVSPVSAPPPVAPTPEQAPSAPPPAAVPQAGAPVYTLDQLAKAGAELAQAGKMEQCLTLLAKYGVQTVTSLQPEQHGAFATELRALGAQL